ncbi:MAG TPA: hypothetical protein VME66_10975 [Candidatus Acidoferrales bacterium]|nr:hypothetical protein [Candidatus Acidoferrales bacterium]
MYLVTQRFERISGLAAAALCCLVAGCGGGAPGSSVTPPLPGANTSAALEEVPERTAAGLQVFPLPIKGVPRWVIADGSTVWYDAQTSVGSVTKKGVVTAYPRGGFAGGASSYGNPAIGPDGNIWFVGQIGASTLGTSFIGHTTSAGGVVQFPISTPVPGPGYADPCLGGIAAGSDGALWFTNGCAGYIGRITTSGTVTATYTTPATCGNVGAIVEGPDHNLWFTSACGLGRIVPATGAITEFPIGGGIPYQIVVSAYHDLWFAYTIPPGAPNLYPTTGLGRITIAGTVKTYPLLQSFVGGESIQGIAAGPDDDIWFTVATYDALYAITQSGGSGPQVTVNASPSGLVSVSDKNIWFADPEASAIDSYTF